MIAADPVWVSAMNARVREAHRVGLVKNLGSLDRNCRCVLVPIRQGSWPQDVTVPPPVMRGRIVTYTPPPPELPDGLWERAGRFWFECRSCESATEWHGEPAEFEFGHYANVCGGSPRCLP